MMPADQETEKLIEAARAVVEHTEQKPNGEWFITGDGEILITRLADALASSHPATNCPAWRPEVRAFADLMETQLRANDHKAGWKGELCGPLYDRLREEMLELEEELFDPARDHILVGKEAADVANFAMMIADVCGALPPPSAGEVGWRPIESAPKDGTKILAFNGETSGDVEIQYWDEKLGWAIDPTAWRDPTHWQPLPSPPDAKPDKGEVGS